MTQPRILITRTQPGADRLAQILQKTGINAKCQPLLQVEFTEADNVQNFDDIQGFILTSAAAIRALPTPDKIDDLPIYCVGAQTAAQAKDAGYKNCVAGTGNGKKLAKLIAHTKDPKAGKLLWLRGEIADEAMARKLQKSGFILNQQICYRTQSIKALTKPIAQTLSDNEFDAVLFHSRRAAETFRKLSPKIGGQTNCIAFSPQIAEILHDVGFASIAVCKQPNDQTMIATLQEMFSLS